MTERDLTRPLPQKEFEQALRKGLGRAVMHARNHGMKGLETTIINATVHNLAYDAQCEGSRAEWIVQLFETAKAQHLFAELVPQLANPADEYWDAVQRSDIAFLLAQRGVTGARDSLYASLRAWPDSGDVIGTHAIIALDGADGLIHVSEFLGKQSATGEDCWSDDQPILWFDEKFGNGAGRRVLDAAARNSAAVVAYLQHIDKDRAEEGASSRRVVDVRNVALDRIKPPAVSKKSAFEVIEEVRRSDAETKCYWLTQWGNRATKAELRQVFEAMVAEANVRLVEKFLRAFVRAGLSAFDEGFVQYANSPDPEVRRLACVAMSHYSHDVVRRLALERLSTRKLEQAELNLLNLNYRTGDAVLIERCLTVVDDAGDMHSLVSDLVELYEFNQVSEAANSMLFVYENSPCSMCRHKAVKTLDAIGHLPDWMVEECAYDSNDALREFAADRR